MARRITIPDDGKPSPDRSEAARKAWRTIRANMPKKLAAEIDQTTLLLDKAQKAMVRSFNRWQKYQERLKRLQRRMSEYTGE